MAFGIRGLITINFINYASRTMKLALRFLLWIIWPQRLFGLFTVPMNKVSIRTIPDGSEKIAKISADVNNMLRVCIVNVVLCVINKLKI